MQFKDAAYEILKEIGESLHYNDIPDFVCIKKKLIIELDGGQHLEQTEYDAERTKFLEALGYKVIRFWNNDVMNDTNGIIRSIQFALEEEFKILR